MNDDEKERVILAGFGHKGITTDQSDVLSNTRLSPGLSAAICRHLECESVVNSGWLMMVFFRFCLNDTKIYEYWQSVWDLVDDCVGDLEVLKVVLQEAMKDTKISWFASEVAYKMIQHTQEGDMEEVRGLYSTIEGPNKLKDLISWNKDITSLLNMCKFAAKLGMVQTNNFFHYINQQNPVFKNLYQIESMGSVDIKEFNLTFEKDGVLCVQVINTVMIIWVNDTTNYKINLTNLIRYSFIDPKTVRLVFKKLGRFNTVNYKLNNFILEMCFKREKLIEYFINRLRRSQALKPKCQQDNLPVLLTLDKQVKPLERLNQLSSSQFIIESPPKIATDRKVITVNTTSDIDRNIFNNRKLWDNIGFDSQVVSELSEVYSSQFGRKRFRTPVLQVPRSQEEQTKQVPRSREAQTKQASQGPENWVKMNTNGQTVFEVYNDIVSNARDTPRTTRSGKVIPLAGTREKGAEQEEEAKQRETGKKEEENETEGTQEITKRKKRKIRLIDLLTDDVRRSSSSPSDDFGSRSPSFHQQEMKMEAFLQNNGGEATDTRTSNGTGAMDGIGDISSDPPGVVDSDLPTGDFSVLDVVLSSEENTTIMKDDSTKHWSTKPDQVVFQNQLLTRYLSLGEEMKRNFRSLLDQHHQGLQEILSFINTNKS